MVGGYVIIDLTWSAKQIFDRLSMNNFSKAIYFKNVKLGTTTTSAFGSYVKTGNTIECSIPYVSGGKVFVSAYTITESAVSNKQINIVEE